MTYSRPEIISADEPENEKIDVKIIIKPGKVILTFSKAITNLEMEPKVARRLAELLRQTSYKTD